MIVHNSLFLNSDGVSFLHRICVFEEKKQCKK